MFTFNSVSNALVLAVSVGWLVFLPLTVRRMVRKRSKRTLLDTACNSVMAVLWLLSVWLPFQRHGTLNTGIIGPLFWAGIVVSYLSGLLNWWRGRSAGAA